MSEGELLKIREAFVLKMKKWMYPLSAAVAVGVLSVTTLPTYASADHGTQHEQRAKHVERSSAPFQHVYVIMMENEGTQQIIGNENAPYITKLANTYGYENNYFGVTHESLANYVAFLSGNNWGTHSDDPTQMFNHTNLVDQLVAHHISWKGYMQNMPSVGYTGYWYPNNEPAGTSPSTTPSNALYAKKHNPFMLMTDIADNQARTRNVVPLTQLQKDLKSNHVPNFSFITPNVINDMHGQPPYTMTNNQLIAAGNKFIQNTVDEIMSSKSWKSSKSVIYITWDEAEYPTYGVTPSASTLATFTAPGPDAPIVPAGTVDGYNWNGGAYGGGKVPMIMIDNAAKGHFTLNTWADHYSLLRTIEQNWNIGYIGYASDAQQVRTLNIPGEPQWGVR